MSSPCCPNQKELACLLAGKLRAEALEAMAEHLDHCPDCLSALRGLAPNPDPLLTALGPQSTTDPYLDELECRQALARFRGLVVNPLPGGMGAGSHQEETTSLVPLPRLLGRYRLLEELGRGAMGTVYRAVHTRLRKVVAVKILASDRVTEPTAVARFRREMEAAGRLDHPNLIRALDADEVGGTHFLVMEFVDGIDLSRLVKRAGPFAVADACELVRQAAVGVQHAHEHGLVHRDLKPSNLMLTSAGQVKVLDLGLALLHQSSPGDEALTTTGRVVGTFDYMAPEQASDTHSVDIRADLYSLGCTLYRFLAGRAPFQDADTPFRKMQAHTQAPVPPVRGYRPEVPEALAAVLDRLLAKEPADRFATPAEAAAALEPFTAGCNLPALLAVGGRSDTPREPAVRLRPPGSGAPPLTADDGRTGRWRSRRALGAGLAATVLVLAGVLLGMVPPLMRSSSPVLEDLRITVRRDGKDNQLYYLDLVLRGTPQEPEPLDPPLRVPWDDFQLTGRFARPTCWYLVWIDTAGKVSVEGRSEGKQAEIRYPASAGHMASVDPVDPAGVHLLALVAGSLPPSEGEVALTGQLQTMGRPPQAVSRRWAAQLRGPGGERAAPPGPEAAGYLDQLTERIPPGLELVHVLFLRTEK